MKPTAADKVAAYRRKLDRLREEGGGGAEVIVTDDTGRIETVHHLRRLPDGSIEWTDAVVEPGDKPHADAA